MNVEETWNRIDIILEHCLAEIQDQGRSIEDCLDRYPTQRVELESLLRLAIKLQSGRAVQAAPQLRTESLIRLSSMAAKIPHQHRKGTSILTWSTWLRQRRLPAPQTVHARSRLSLQWIALWAVVLIVTFTGALAASAQSLPGNWLYSVKRAQERVRLSLTSNPLNEASLHLRYANRRIDEALKLAEQSQTAALGQVLVDYSEGMQREYFLLIQADELSPDQQRNLVSQILETTVRFEEGLAAVSNQAPPSVFNEIQVALATTRKLQNQAQEIRNNQDTGNQPAPTLQEGSRFTPMATPKMSTTPAPSRNSPTANPHIGQGTGSRTSTPITATQTGRTPGNIKDSLTPTDKRTPTPEAPSSSAGTLLPTQCETTPANIKASPTPADTKPPSADTSNSSIATRSATQADVKPSYTPQLLPDPSKTPANESPTVFERSPVASSTPRQ